jgi:integrase
LIAQWLASNRQIIEPSEDTTVVELIAAYWRFAQSYYVKNGEPTTELDGIKAACRWLKRLYGRTRVADFKPSDLKATRQQMIDAGNCRKYVNKNTGRIKRVFKWGVEHEIVPVTVYQALDCVAGLKAGRTQAPEMEPIQPVSDSTIEATMPHLSERFADMVRLHRFTGMRPGEVGIMHTEAIDRSGDVWKYVPESHKTEHHGKSRTIYVGPQAQRIVAKWLLRASGGYLFVGKTGKPTSERMYRAAIHRACKKAKMDKWNPGQIRHTTGTEVRAKFGVEMASTILGHSNLSTTEIYAEVNHEKAARIAREIG